MSWYDETVDFSILKGKVIKEIQGNVDSEELVFICEDGSEYKMFHSQDCCESVSIDDICGDLQDLIGEPIINASEDSNSDNPKDSEYPDESFTWTFYNINTIKGHVTIRWYGSSNGYYSESVSFVHTNGKDE